MPSSLYIRRHHIPDRSSRPERRLINVDGFGRRRGFVFFIGNGGGGSRGGGGGGDRRNLVHFSRRGESRPSRMVFELVMKNRFPRLCSSFHILWSVKSADDSDHILHAVSLRIMSTPPRGDNKKNKKLTYKQTKNASTIFCHVPCTFEGRGERGRGPLCTGGKKAKRKRKKEPRTGTCKTLGKRTSPFQEYIVLLTLWSFNIITHTQNTPPHPCSTFGAPPTCRASGHGPPPRHRKTVALRRTCCCEAEPIRCCALIAERRENARAIEIG